MDETLSTAPEIPGSTATYSPDDNKLRFYAPTRLSAEDYATIRAAGFSWAPKQELWVAPAWSPDREDLLVRWAGEITDEDTTLAERAEERADRFEGYEDSRRADAQAAHAAVHQIADGIPFGQPILVGHHSEKRARRDAERIQNGMAKAVRAWDTANYWKERAAGALAAAKYKEAPGVRSRRIKRIEADLRKVRKDQAEGRDRLKFWQEVASRLSREGLIAACGRMASDGEVTLADGTRHWSTYSALESGKIEPAEVIRQRLESLPRADAGLERWAQHYDRRLEYERAMLAAVGGTVADQTGPEIGGACRCWASPSGGWSLIQKVNRVSVTLLDNWGNGGRDFTRTIPFDKLKAVMSRAQVDEARAAGRVHGETPRGFHLLPA